MTSLRMESVLLCSDFSHFLHLGSTPQPSFPPHPACPHLCCLSRQAYISVKAWGVKLEPLWGQLPHLIRSLHQPSLHEMDECKALLMLAGPWIWKQEADYISSFLITLYVDPSNQCPPSLMQDWKGLISVFLSKSKHCDSLVYPL